MTAQMGAAGIDLGEMEQALEEEIAVEAPAEEAAAEAPAAS
jgi:small subunit ribosomal protein S2